MDEKNIISIVKNQGTPVQEIIDIKTDGFALLYFKGEEVKIIGDIALKALTPLIMKAALDKWVK